MITKIKAFLGRFVETELTVAQGDASDANNGLRTRNEIRVKRGLPPIDNWLANQLTITTKDGIKPV